MIVERFNKEDNTITLVRELFEEIWTDSLDFLSVSKNSKKSDYIIVLEFNTIISSNTYKKFKKFFDYLDDNCDDWRLYIWKNKFKCLIVPDKNFVNSLEIRKNSKKYNI